MSTDPTLPQNQNQSQSYGPGEGLHAVYKLDSHFGAQRVTM